MNTSKHLVCKRIAKTERQIQEQSNETLLRNCIQAWKTTVHNKTYGKKEEHLLNRNVRKLARNIKKLKLLKRDIELIKKRWKNRELQILTEEIRDNVENHNMRNVWQRINQLKNQPNSNQKHTGFINSDGKLKVRTPDVLAIMTAEIKKHFHQSEADKREGKTEINELNWENDENNNTYMIPHECGKKRNDSKLRKYFNSQEDQYMENKLTDKFNHIEVHRAINALNNRKAVGTDRTSGEIWKKNVDWLATFATHLLNQCAELFWMPHTWKQGIITYIYKAKERNMLKNYRPITLLNMIYKIWAAIMSNRLTPILNLLTSESQTAYKDSRSTLDFLSLLQKNIKTTTPLA